MAKPAPRRDNDYYLERLRVEQPAVYRDYKAGKFKNVSEALRVGGLRQQRDSLTLLKSAWNRANTAEKDAFKLMIGCVAPANVLSPTATAPPVPLSPSTYGHANRNATVLQATRKLSPVLAAAVRQIMDRRKLKTGQIMREMGMNPRDASLGMALQRETQLRDDLVKALDVWVERNSRR